MTTRTILRSRWVRRLTIGRIAAMLIAVAAVLTMSPAPANAWPWSYDWIQNKMSHQCLDADANQIWPGGRVQAYGCWSGANQHWGFDKNMCRSGPYCLLRVDSDHRLCLQGSYYSGDELTLNWCDVGNDLQLWWHTTDNDAWWQLGGSYLVIDLDRACAGSNGCKVQIYSWWGGDNQRWYGPS